MDIPALVDTHVHLLAGLDDGPRTPDDAIGMCWMMHDQGVRYSVALAHQNDDYPLNDPARIQTAFERLTTDLRNADLPLNVVVGAEIMVRPDVFEAYDRGDLLTYGDQKKYLLFEMPHGMCVEVGWVVERFVSKGVRPVLAHAERCPELIEDLEMTERLVRLGCLMQISSMGITHPPNRATERVLKDWFRRGIAHVLCSDGHSLRRRPPDLRDAYLRVRDWAGPHVADRVGSIHGMAVLLGMPLRQMPIQPRSRSWFARFW